MAIACPKSKEELIRQFKFNPEVDTRLEAFMKAEPGLVQFVKELPREQLERKFLLRKMRDRDQRQSYTAHSTVTLTTKTYISSASLPLAEAIRRVPAIVSGIKADTPIDTPDTPIDTLKPVAPCHSVSQADASSQNAYDPKTLINKGSGRDLTLSVAQSRNAGNGRGDRIRTCDLVVPNHALYQAKLRPAYQQAGTPGRRKQPK
jgi:hypothetical protein